MNIRNFRDWVEFGQYNRWFFMKDMKTTYDSLLFALKTNNYSEVRELIRRVFKYSVDNLRDDEIQPFVYQQIFQYVHYQHILVSFIPAAMYYVHKRFVFKEGDRHISDGVFYGILCDFEIENLKYDITEENESFKDLFFILYEKNKDKNLIKWKYMSDLSAFENTWKGYIEESLAGTFFMCMDLKIGNEMRREIEELCLPQQYACRCIHLLFGIYL